MILLSEGLALPTSAQPLLRTIINTASQSGVSIYAVDAAGLRIESAQAETSRQIQSQSAQRMSQLGSVSDPFGPMTKGLERNERMLKLDPRSGLGDLADQTGGFLIHDTNDLKGRMGRIGEDLRNYYLVNYTPKDQSSDGSFRKIEVKVKRSGVSVQNRKGYFAINTSYGSPVLDFETPALALAANNRQPKDLAVRSAAMSFPEASRTGLVAALAEIPMQAITFHSEDKTKTFSTDFSVVAIFKSSDKQVVRKLSHHYMLTGPLASLDATRKDEVLFYREEDLAPGQYQMQAIVYDAFGEKAGVSEATIDVPQASDSDLRVSSIVLIKRAERLDAREQKSFNPFHVGELLAYPNLGETIQKAKYKQLPFFFTVYVPKGAGSPPKLMIQLAQHGQALAQLPAELPPADQAGRVQYAGSLPLESIPVGQYEFKIIVTSGTDSITRSVQLDIAN